MIATPPAPPPLAAAPPLRPATAARSASRRGGSLALLERPLRLVPLLAAGLVAQLGWSIVWVLGYRLTHGNDFTYTYLVEQPRVWERLYDLLLIAVAMVPGIEPPQALDPLVNSLVVGFVFAGLGYVGALVLLDRGVVPPRLGLITVLAGAALFHVTLFFMPGIYTTDIFSYMMYGQIASSYGLNPYIYPPAAFPANPLLGWIHPIWHQSPSVYGPLWTDLGWAFTPLVDRFGSSPWGLTQQVFAYKALMSGVHLLNLGLVWWLLGRFRPDGGSLRGRVVGFTLFAWNPVVLFELVGNAHNDALMVTLLLLSLVPLALRPRLTWPGAAGGARLAPSGPRWLASLLLVTLSALVKYVTGVVGVFYAVAWAARLPTWRARAAWLGAAAVLAAGLTLALFWPWLKLPEVLGPILDAAGGKLYTNSVPDLAALTVADQVLDPLGRNRGAAQETARFWAKAITRLAFVVYLAWEARRVWRQARAAGPGEQGALSVAVAIVEASTRAFLVLVLLVLTWVLAWYFSWPLALSSLLGWRRLLTKVVVGYTVVCLPVFYLHHYWSTNMSGAWVLLYAGLPLLLPAGEYGRRWWSARQATPPAEHAVAEHAVAEHAVAEHAVADEPASQAPRGVPALAALPLSRGQGRGG